MQTKAVNRASLRVLAIGVVAAFVGVTLVAGVEPAWTAPEQRSQTFNYTGSIVNWTVPEGVTSLTVEVRGGQGGNGGQDGTNIKPPIGSYRGVVTGTIDVTPAQTITVAVGQGGRNGGDGVQTSAQIPAGGSNPLAGYRGGAGGQVGPSGSSGQGGAGGAASVVRVGGIDVVAAGGGGNGGSGQFAPTRGRPATDVFAGRTDTTSTNGQAGFQPVGGTNPDGGGSGGGGGGAQGGAQGRVEFGAGTSTEWFGWGGSVGQNATAGIAGLSAAYEHVNTNTGDGTVVFRWVIGTAAAPNAPQGTAGIGSVELYWNAPTQIGQGPINDYQVQYSSDNGATWSTSLTVGSADRDLVVEGLSNDTAYRFRVAAVTPAGVGDFSPASQPLTPRALPGKPVITEVAAQDGALAVTFTPPSSGAPVTGYQYRVDGGGWVPVAGTTQPITIAGLVNGTNVEIELRATSVVGFGQVSDPAAGTPRAVPGAPTIVATSTIPGGGSVLFTPGADGGSTIIDYEYQVGSGAWQPVPADESPLELSGLGTGTSTEVRIRAVNAAGAGAPSAIATIVTPGTPAALLDTTAVGLDGAISVDFALGANGGSPITLVQYSIDGGATWTSVGTSGPIVITGLDNGMLRSALLRAVNAVGFGPALHVSATPMTAPGAPVIDAISRDTGSGSLEVVFSAPAVDGGSTIFEYEYSTDGGASWRTAGSVAAPLTIDVASDGSTLDEGTEYTLSLRAVNEAGAGPGSSGRTTLGPVPAVLASAPTITSVGSRPGALSVDFTPGANGGAAVDEYQYSVDGGSTWRSTGSLGTRFLIAGLADGTEYEVHVRAVTAAGEGASSDPVSGTPASSPQPPTLDEIERGDGQLTVSLTAGANGGSAITELEYTLDGGATWMASGRVAGPLTITGLHNGQAYTVQVRAVNAVGASSGSNQLTAAPVSVPAAPTLVLTPGDTTVAAVATFSSTGGAPITRVEYSLDAGGTWHDTGSISGSFLSTGHTNGTPVQMLVRGVNAIGVGAAATQSATPRTLPDAPTDVTTVGNTGAVEVSWTAPAFNGGSAITGYNVRVYATATSMAPVASCLSFGMLSCNVPSLTNGATYFVAVAAMNDAGTGPESVRRPSATPLVRPGAPALTGVTPGDQRLALTFTAGTAGDRPIQRYEYTIDAGATWHTLGTTSPANVTGLTNGQLYSVQIRAVSEAGPGAASAARTGTPFGFPLAPTDIAAAPGVASATVTWTHADLNGNSLQRYAVTLFDSPSGGNIVGGGTKYTAGTTESFTGLTNGTTYYVSIQTETSTGTTTGVAQYSERSNPRVAVTPQLAGTAPTFGTPTRTADGYTVVISNYDSGSLYALDTSALPAGASASRSGNTVTVIGVAPGESGQVGVTVNRTGRLPASANVSGTALAAGIAPEFDTPVRGIGSYTVVISNYDAAASYAIDTSVLPLGAAASRVGDTITVTGLANGATGTLTVRASKAGFTDGEAEVSGTALNAALNPTFANVTRTADGFTLQVTNFDSDFAWTSTANSGSATISATGLVTVTGLSPSEWATVSVQSTRDGYRSGSGGVSTAALGAGIAPTFGTVTRTEGGFVVPISNWDTDAIYTLDTSSLPAGASASWLSNEIVVTGLDAGASVNIGVSLTKPGYTGASGDVTGTALDAALTPVFGTPTRTDDGYTVQITNYDDSFFWTLSATGGTVTASSAGLVTVTGLAPGASSTVTASTQRDGYVTGTGSTTAAALQVGVVPTFTDLVRTPDGYTVTIDNFDASSTYVIDDSALPSGASVSRTGASITVSGVSPAASATIVVRASAEGFTTRSAGVTASALESGVLPMFGTVVRTVDGFTVQITNFASDSTYVLDTLPAGSVVLVGDTLVVTGLTPEQAATVNVSVQRTGTADVSAGVAGAAQAAGTAPKLSAPRATSDGYEVMILDYDPQLEYVLSVSAGSVSRNGALITVRGLQPGQQAVLSVTSNNADTASNLQVVSGAAAVPAPNSEEIASTGGSSPVPMVLISAVLLLIGALLIGRRRERDSSL